MTKNRIKKYIILFIIIDLILFNFACKKKSPNNNDDNGNNNQIVDEETPMGESGTWSIYLYLCGSNLETKQASATKNLKEILSVDLPDNVNIIVQTGGSKKWRGYDISSSLISRYKVTNQELELIETLPQNSMGSSSTLESFLHFAVTNYPAEKMAVILWDHGSGSVHGVCNDENYNYDALKPSELKNAFDSVSKIMTDRFELVGFDACLMANYETASIVMPYARYMLASEEVEPSGGWNYVSILNAFNNKTCQNGQEFCQIACDGYMEKCLNSGSGDVVTLSGIDLTKFKDLQEKFNALASEMANLSIEVKGIQNIAQAIKNSQKFGGVSKNEGFSNMVDLGHFGDNVHGLSQASSMLDALDETIICKVAGAQKKNSSGLSFYYPLNINDNELSTYCNDICESTEYSSYLTSVFSNIPENPIIFIDRGSKTDDCIFHVELDEKSRNYILSIDFQLLEYVLEDNALIASYYGRDNDINGTYLSFNSNFRGIWLALNGCKLFSTPIEYSDEYIIFTSPIILNGERTNLRFAFIWDDVYDGGGYYKILGTWDGLDYKTGMSDKDIVPINQDDVISAVYQYQKLYIDEFGELKTTEILESIQEVPLGNYEITEVPLSGINVMYQFVITDIFGKEYFSNIALFSVTKTEEEIKNLVDGESAGIIDFIIETDSSIIE